MEMITSAQNAMVKYLFKLRTNHDFRQHEGSVVLEGATLIEEVSRIVTPKKLWVSHPEAIPKSLKEFPHQLVTEEIIKKIAGGLHPEGIIAEFPLPKPQTFKDPQRMLVLDRVSDPGNLGTLLRSALAFGWDAVFLIRGGCDPFNDKVLRASKGALFHLPYHEGTWKEAQEWISKFSLTPVAADIKGMALRDFKIPSKIALILGNESQGISEEIRRASTGVTIPMKGKMESLNVAVAGGIMMHWMSGENVL